MQAKIMRYMPLMFMAFLYNFLRRSDTLLDACKNP